MTLTLEVVVYISHLLISANTTHLTLPWSVAQSTALYSQDWHVRYRLSNDITTADTQFASYHEYLITIGINAAPRGTVVSELKYTYNTIGVQETFRGSYLQHYLEFTLSRRPSAASRVQHDHGVPTSLIGSSLVFRAHTLNTYLQLVDDHPLFSAGPNRRYLLESLSVSANYHEHQSVISLFVTRTDGESREDLLPGHLSELTLSENIVISDVTKFERRYRQGPTYLGSYWYITYTHPSQ